MERRKLVLVVFSLMLCIQYFSLFGITFVNGESMNNTLKDGNPYIYADKNFKKIQRFDIVLIESKTLNEYIVKRVIGVPGEKVEYEGNKLYIDGVEVEQNFDYIPKKNDFEYFLQEL